MTAGKRRAAAWVLLLALLVAGGRAATQESRYTVESTVFLPQQFYVGDAVEARIRVRVEGAGRGLSAPEQPPEPAWGSIRRILVSGAQGAYEVRISFTAFRPGTQTFPSIDLGPITLEGIDFHVASVLGAEESELSPVRNQLLLPQTRVLMTIVLAVLFGIPLMLLIAFPWLRRRWHDLLALYRARRPYRKLRKSLERLQDEAARLSGREFYIRLLDDARRYLTRRLGFDCMSATTGELREVISVRLSDDTLVETLTELFELGDLVKFAERSAPLEQRLGHIDALRRTAGQLEKQRKQGSARHATARERSIVDI